MIESLFSYYNPTFTGTVSGITKGMVGLSNVNDTSDLTKPVSTAQQTALDLKAPLANVTALESGISVTSSNVTLAGTTLGFGNSNVLTQAMIDYIVSIMP